MLFFVPTLLNSAASFVIIPIVKVSHWVSYSGSSLPVFIRDRLDLMYEIENLRSDLVLVNEYRLIKNSILEENIQLRRLMGDENQNRILAGIIGRPGMMPHDSLIIDQGIDDGVVPGAPVFIGENTVIGIVKHTTGNTSLVELSTSNNFVTTVYIVGPDIYATAVGVGGGKMRVGVPQGIELSVGDLVLMPSIISGLYGEISVVKSDPTGPEQYGYVSPHTSIASLRFVSVGQAPLEHVSFEEAQYILANNKTTIFTVPVPDEILIDVDDEVPVESENLLEISNIYNSSETTTQSEETVSEINLNEE